VARRPRGIAALTLFFVIGALIAGTCAVALAFPGDVLEPMWRLKPEAREAFRGLGIAAIVLMSAVAAACAGAAIGLWRGARWGHRLAFAVLAINLVGDSLNATIGHDPRAWVGVPITGLLLVYLGSPGVRRHFGAEQSRA
jgi:hypothetical protein